MASVWSDTLKQTICLDTERIYRQHDKNSVTQRHTHTHAHLTVRVLGENMIFLLICVDNVTTAVEHSGASHKSVFAAGIPKKL